MVTGRSDAYAAASGGGVFAGIGGGALPAWVESLPLWEWYSIPNTALSSVDPTPTPLGVVGPSSKISIWCGATLKRAGSVYMLGAAGGHGDYGGNEVDAIQLNAATPAWAQLRAPTPDADIINLASVYLDYRPAPRHTYWSTQFLESRNRMVIVCGAGMNSNGLPAAPVDWPYMNDTHCHSFNPTPGVLDWDTPGTVPVYPGTGDSVACLCAKHPTTDDIYYSRNGSDGFYKLTASTLTWSKISNYTLSPWYMGSAIDPTRSRLLAIGGFSVGAAKIIGLDGVEQTVTFGGLGSALLERLANYVSIVYDEANDSYIIADKSTDTVDGLPYGDTQLTVVNAGTLVVTRPTVTGTKPSGRPNGYHNSMQYVPELRGIVLANQHGESVKFMRTAL